jgi:hypothetical protein
MSDDGTLLLGTLWLGEAYYEAVKWTEGPEGWEAERLGNGSASPGWASTAMDVADNGTIVGFDFLQTSRRAWIQPGGAGSLIKLSNFIESNGGVVPPDVVLGVCQAISTDGRIIAGHSWPETGGWLVRIRPDCPADINGDREVNTSDLLALLAAWGNISGPEDINGDGIVDVADLLELLATWGPCPAR